MISVIKGHDKHLEPPAELDHAQACTYSETEECTCEELMREDRDFYYECREQERHGT